MNGFVLFADALADTQHQKYLEDVYHAETYYPEYVHGSELLPYGVRGNGLHPELQLREDEDEIEEGGEGEGGHHLDRGRGTSRRVVVSLLVCQRK